MKDLDTITQYLQKFAKARDWEQFHNPKNLSMALSVEAAELMEHFQWLSNDDCQDLSAEKIEAAGEEIVDVLLYAVRLASVLGLDLPAAIDAKTRKNELKYPIDKVKGSAKKYNEYD